MHALPKSARLNSLIFSLFLLSACGGGGGSTTTNSGSSITVPSAPQIGVAAAGNGQASVAFSAPTSNGGADISAYTASCVTGSSSAVTNTASSSPIVVTGLTNNSVYSCTVTATNSVGASPSSTSVSVTPAAVITVTVPGAPVIGVAAAGSTQVSVAFSAPTSNGGADISAYTASCVTGSSSAVTNTASSSPIIVTGLTNNSVYSCTVTATNSAGTGSASSAVSVTPVTSTTLVTYSTPAPFVNVVATTYTPSTNLVRDTNAMATRVRYMISDVSSAGSTSNYLSIGATFNASTGYTVESGTITAASTYNNYLSKLVQAVAATDGHFRLDSHLHPNNSIDADSADNLKLKFRNNFGKASTTYGYVTFSYNTSTNLLQAKNRYTYSYNSTTYAATYTLDTSFANTGSGYYVNYAGGVYKLVSDISSATRLYLYSSPINLGIPTFMDPMATSFVTQGAASFINKVNSTTSWESQIASGVKSTYSNQVSAAGSNATTKINADTKIASIKSVVEGAGGSLRYAPALYTAFRDGLLANKLVSDSISDGKPGQNLVPYVYFTNEADSSGTYHPFMVVINYGNQASPNGLKDIPSPPCSGTCGTAVTRFSNLENYITMIPLRDYGQVTDVTQNTTLTTNLWSDAKPNPGYVGSTLLTKNEYTYADIADNGLLIDGSVMFPAFNNTLVPSHLRGELSASGCHVGQGGGGPHCHADGYQQGQGLGLYNDADYLSKTHPPIIGFGYDGIALFAKYRSSDSSLLGYGTALDGFGGHNHDSIGYHYHAHTVPDYQPDGLSSAYKSTLHVLMKGAYIGRVDSIPYFRSRTVNSLTTNKYMGGTVP